MKKLLTIYVTIGLILVVAGVAVGAGAIVVPDGTISASGYDGYDYVISSIAINAQDCAETHVRGTVTGYSLPNINSGWFTIGLITKYQRDRALTTYGVASYMFNHSVFMMAMKGNGGDRAMPSDYAGDFPGGVGQEQFISAPFNFDLKLVPNIGGTGGMAYLSINGGPYGTGLAYGKDNWNNYGWNEPSEDLSDAYLVVQLYTWDAGTYSVSFKNVIATGCLLKIVIDGCDTGVTDRLFPDNSSISENIGQCEIGANNHGKFVSCVAQVTNDAKKAGIITGQEKGAIQSCAAKANIP
jgi:hypothetical protein